MKQISLYYRDGSSDKEYHVHMEPRGDRYVVNFAYGRRGSTLSTGTKTNSPVDEHTATRLFEKLVGEKKAKGYTEGAAGTPYQHTEKSERVSCWLPQLLNPIEEERVQELVRDDDWGLQEKLDGKRVLLVKRAGTITGVNRKGLTIGLPESILKAAGQIDGDFVMDGECITHLFFTFDLLSWRGEDVRSLGFHQRSTALLNLLARAMQKHIHFVPTFYDAKSKERVLNELRKTKREGVVFKRLDAPYTAGRPNSGGTQLKHKFYATCSAVVAKVNAQRSVELRLLGGDGWRPAGNVTIPANHHVPRVGDVVEVRYLYAFAESGALYQPVYLGVRSDIPQHDCGVSQLKYKAGEEET